MTTDHETLAVRRDEIRARHLRARSERPPTTARGVHHVAMICRDVEETIAFYQDVVGFPLTEVLENRDYPGSTHFFFDLGHDNLLGFFDFPGLGLGDIVEAVGGLQHLAISVTPEAFDGIKARLEERGIDYVGPDRGADDSLYFKDPNGIQIETLREPLAVMCGKPLL